MQMGEASPIGGETKSEGQHLLAFGKGFIGSGLSGVHKPLLSLLLFGFRLAVEAGAPLGQDGVALAGSPGKIVVDDLPLDICRIARSRLGDPRDGDHGERLVVEGVGLLGGGKVKQLLGRIQLGVPLMMAAASMSQPEPSLGNTTSMGAPWP